VCRKQLIVGMRWFFFNAKQMRGVARRECQRRLRARSFADTLPQAMLRSSVGQRAARGTARLARTRRDLAESADEFLVKVVSAHDKPAMAPGTGDRAEHRGIEELD